MKIFVINLPERTDKKNVILDKAKEYGITLEIVEAIKGKSLPEEEIARTVYDYPACAMTKGVIGCALSHLKVYKMIFDANHPIALVLEDDAILSENLSEVLEEIEQLDKNISPQVYLLSSHYYKSRPQIKLTEKYALHKFVDGSQGHGYALNQKAAEALYKNLFPVKWEADKWYYFQEMGLVSVNCVVPHVVGVNGEAEISDLYAERAPGNKQRRTYLNKLRKVVPVSHQVRKLMWKLFRRPFAQKS